MLTVLSGYDRLVTDSKVSWTYVTKSDSYRGGYPDPCDTQRELFLESIVTFSVHSLFVKLHISWLVTLSD